MKTIVALNVHVHVCTKPLPLELKQISEYKFMEIYKPTYNVLTKLERNFQISKYDLISQTGN